MVLDIRHEFLTLVIIINAITILGCVSNNANPTQNNTTANITGNFPTVTGNLSIDASNYNDSYGLAASEKLEAIKIALGAPQIQTYLQEFPNVQVDGVLPDNVSGKPSRVFSGSFEELWADSGFLNTSDNIVYVPLTGSRPLPALPGNPYLAVYVNLKDGKVVGADIFEIRSGARYTITDLPANSYWYHQLVGSTRVGQEYNTIRMQPYVFSSYNDTGMIYPLILDKDNFEKFRNGSRYEALQYTDYVTHQTHLIDGKTAISPLWELNGSAAWGANISTSYWAPSDKIYSDRPTDFYIVLQNKANRAIPITLQNYETFFFN